MPGEKGFLADHDAGARKKTTYKGNDVLEMFPDNSKEKTILTRTNPKPK